MPDGEKDFSFTGRITIHRAGGSYVAEITDKEAIRAFGTSRLPLGSTGPPLEVLQKMQRRNPEAEVVLSPALADEEDPFPTREKGYLHRHTRWFVHAMDAGVERDVARLGSEVMRRSREEGWPTGVQAKCGWEEGSGEAMLRLALDQPRAARQRWQSLLDEYVLPQ